jgi:transcriptional regulator with XRE-family HTH domain
MRTDAMEPLALPEQVWDKPETMAALRERRIGYLFQLAQQYAGASQTRIANVTGMAQSEVSRIRNGDRQVTAIDVLERVARGFLMPDRARVQLGLAPRAWSTGAVAAGEGQGGRESPARASDAGQQPPAELHAQVLVSAGQLAYLKGDYVLARELAGRGLTEARRVGDPRATAQALNLLGVVAMNTGDYELASLYYRQILAVQHRRGGPSTMAGQDLRSAARSGTELAARRSR